MQVCKIGLAVFRYYKQVHQFLMIIDQCCALAAATRTRTSGNVPFCPGRVGDRQYQLVTCAFHKLGMRRHSEGFEQILREQRIFHAPPRAKSRDNHHNRHSAPHHRPSRALSTRGVRLHAGRKDGFAHGRSHQRQQTHDQHDRSNTKNSGQHAVELEASPCDCDQWHNNSPFAFCAMHRHRDAVRSGIHHPKIRAIPTRFVRHRFCDIGWRCAGNRIEFVNERSNRVDLFVGLDADHRDARNHTGRPYMHQHLIRPCGAIEPRIGTADVCRADEGDAREHEGTHNSSRRCRTRGVRAHPPCTAAIALH